MSAVTGEEDTKVGWRELYRSPVAYRKQTYDLCLINKQISADFCLQCDLAAGQEIKSTVSKVGYGAMTSADFTGFPHSGSIQIIKPYCPYIKL